MFDTMHVFCDGKLIRVCSLSGNWWFIIYTDGNGTTTGRVSPGVMNTLMNGWRQRGERIVYLTVLGEE